MIKTDQDIKETQRIYDEILKKYFKWKVKKWQEKDYFGTIWWKNEFIKKWTYIDDDKNTIFISDRDLLVTFVSNINPNGIWDWQKPDIARTYTISVSLYWNKRMYRCKTIEDNIDIAKLYTYDRTIEWLEKKFADKFILFKNRLDTFKIKKTGN